MKNILNSFFKKLNTQSQLGDDLDDFINEIYYINNIRLKILSIPITIVFLGLLIVDYTRYKSGLFEVSPGYRIIFYAHCSAILHLLFAALFIRKRPLKKVSDVTFFHKGVIMVLSNIFLIHIALISMGDVLINGSMASFMGSIFSIAGFFLLTNRFGVQLFLTNAVFMVFLLNYANSISDVSYSIQTLNTSIYILFALFLSRLLYYYHLRDFKNRRFISQQKNKLEQLAMTDPLTRAMNRRSFLKAFTVERLKSIRYNRPLSMVIFDIDFFKGVNDNYGHNIGDQVLVSISTLVKEHIRPGDLFCRWGGEEFIVLSMETDLEGIKQLSEKIRNLIEKNILDDAPTVTASFGVTVFNPEEMIDEMIQRADLALYNAKKDGRNCVRFLI